MCAVFSVHSLFLSLSLSLSLSVKVVKIGKLVDIYRTVGEKLNCDYIYSG